MVCEVFVGKLLLVCYCMVYVMLGDLMGGVIYVLVLKMVMLVEVG